MTFVFLWLLLRFFSLSVVSRSLTILGHSIISFTFVLIGICRVWLSLLNLKMYIFSPNLVRF